MKKQLLAAAIAGIVAAPMTARAGDVALYGTIHMSVDTLRNYSVYGYPVGADWDAATEDNNTLHVNSHYTRFGIRGSESLGHGLSAFFQMEFYLTAAEDYDESNSESLTNVRNTFVGLEGDWGKAGIGRNDTPLKKSTASLELFGDIQGDYNAIGFEDVRLADTVFYYSPNWNGFSFGAAVGIPSYSDEDDGVEVVSLAATYTNGPWFASLAYEDFDNDVADLDNYWDEKWRLGLGWTANGFHVGFLYEDRDHPRGYDGEYSWQISGSYTFGNNVLKAAYGRGIEEWSSSGYGEYSDVQYSIGLDHKLSKRTKVYAIYTNFDSDYDPPIADKDYYDWHSFGLGIVHKF